jgi:hypothetical protein
MVQHREVQARPNIRQAFFEVYPGALGTVLDTVPSFPQHCGVCHYDFAGGGARNAYGLRLEEVLPGFPNNPAGRRDAVLSIEDEDSDGDTFLTLTEVTDLLNFLNTPTFPGLTPADLGSVMNVDPADIEDHLVPSTTVDTTPPAVAVLAPNGGKVLTANGPVAVQWTASDVGGVAWIDLYVSDNGGVSFRPVAMNLPNSGGHTWYPANRPTPAAVFRVTAFDNAFNGGHDDSNGWFTIASPSGGLVPTTLRDFDQPGSQPFEAGSLIDPAFCAFCHGGYEPAVEPAFNWKGSMMAQASRDPLFEACLTIANQDAPDSGDLCLRCHVPAAWLQGRSIPTDGSQIQVSDRHGVSCDLCHRLVDPIFAPGLNPPVDEDILDSLTLPPAGYANGMYIVDPGGTRRGPFADATGGHPILVSPFHREAALCGTCHDVSNPAFESDGAGHYPPGPLDAPAAEIASHVLMPLERTYSEWFFSDYNTPQGVFAPQFGGNLDYVATCQDCHLRDVTGQGCNFGSPPVRPDLPLHDMTGGSTWLAGLLPQMFPGDVDPAAMAQGISRARYMLQNAALIDVEQNAAVLDVTVTNQTGHKLPTGYPEGRRMWLNVRFYDASGNVLVESGGYDPLTGVLVTNPPAKIYEAKLGLDADVASLVGLPAAPSFHFALNNKIYQDNRIPPRGFSNAEYAGFGGAPVGAAYADGQYWDTTTYAIPAGAASAQVVLYYQSTSKEYVEFLRDENTTDNKGQEMFDLWNQNGKSPPEIMGSVTAPLQATGECLASADCADTDDDGIRDDNCIWWTCSSGACSNLPIVFADMGGEYGACVPDGTADGHDRFHALNCFSNVSTLGLPTYPCEANAPQAFAADAGGPFGACQPDGVCDGNDAFHALNAFAGLNACSCPPGGPGPHPAAPLAKPETAELVLRPRMTSVRPGGLFDIDVLLRDRLADLRGYQLHVAVRGGDRGSLELADIVIERRRDAVFSGESPWQAMNLRTAQVVAGLDGAGVVARSGAYLATFTFRASRDAAGAFQIALQHDRTDPAQRTFLFPTLPAGWIDIRAAEPVVMEIEGVERIDASRVALRPAPPERAATGN